VFAAKNAFGVALGLTVMPSQAKSLIFSGFQKMRPDLTTFSLPNDILDAAQTRSLLQFWKNRSLVPGALPKYYLEHNYGWRPLVSDVAAMIDAISGFRKRIADWNKSVGNVVSRQVTVFNQAFYKSGSLTNTPTALGTTSWWGSLDQRITAHIKYRPRPLAEMSKLEQTIRGSLDSLGFELNPGIIYDKIPFSFVVDWFSNIGTQIASFKIDTLELPITLVDSFLQFKEQMVVNSGVKYAADATYQAWELPGVVSVDKTFQRWPVLPDAGDIMSLGWKMPNLRQWALGLSLAAVNSGVT